MDVEYNISREDYGLSQARLMRIVPRIRNMLFGFRILTILITIPIFWIVLSFSLIYVVVAAAVVALILAIPMDWFTSRIVRRIPKEGHGILGQHHLRIDEKGVWESTDVNEGLAFWKSVSAIELDDRFIYIVIGNTLVHAIPTKSFPDSQLSREFVDEARRLWKENT